LCLNSPSWLTGYHHTAEGAIGLGPPVMLFIHSFIHSSFFHGVKVLVKPRATSITTWEPSPVEHVACGIQTCASLRSSSRSALALQLTQQLALVWKHVGCQQI